jgi:hypothetical protein
MHSIQHFYSIALQESNVLVTSELQFISTLYIQTHFTLSTLSPSTTRPLLLPHTLKQWHSKTASAAPSPPLTKTPSPHPPHHHPPPLPGAATPHPLSPGAPQPCNSPRSSTPQPLRPRPIRASSSPRALPPASQSCRGSGAVRASLRDMRRRTTSSQRRIRRRSRRSIRGTGTMALRGGALAVGFAHLLHD